jgi:Ca2+-binding RTX toxin-like protein
VDTIRGLGANDVLNGGNDADSLAGNDGIDAADYRERSGGVRVSLDDQANDGSALDGGLKDNVRSDVENVRGGNGNDTLVGQANAATANTLEGNNGNDTLDGGPGPDKLSGGANTDRVDYSARDSEDIVVSLDSLTINDDGGVSDEAAGRRDDVFGVENVSTGDANDTLLGNSSANVFDSGLGNDHLFGSDGNDTLRPGAGVDEVIDGRDLDKLETTDGQADQSDLLRRGLEHEPRRIPRTRSTATSPTCSRTRASAQPAVSPRLRGVGAPPATLRGSCEAPVATAPFSVEPRVRDQRSAGGSAAGARSVPCAGACDSGSGIFVFGSLSRTSVSAVTRNSLAPLAFMFSIAVCRHGLRRAYSSGCHQYGSSTRTWTSAVPSLRCAFSSRAAGSFRIVNHVFSMPPRAYCHFLSR